MSRPCFVMVVLKLHGNIDMNKKIVIVGGGPAGLAAGIYSRLAGFDSLVLESHGLPGGLCTAWSRNNYTIDGCVHFIVGSGPGSAFHELWKELGVMDGVDPQNDFVYHNDFFHFRFADGREIRFSGDLEKFKKELIAFSPDDKKNILAFTSAVESLSGFEPPLDILKGFSNIIKAGIKSFPYLFSIFKWKNTSIEKFASRFKSRELREAFIRLWYPEYNMLYILLLLDWLRRKVAGYPKINSLGFSKLLEKQLLEKGGTIRYNSRVDKILFDNGKAIGVRLESGEEITGDYIINTAASPWSLNQLLGLSSGDNYPITPPLVHITYGSSYDFSNYESAACGLQLELQPPVEMTGEKRDFVLVHIYNFVDNLAPTGKTLVKVMFPTDYYFWKDLRDNNRPQYNKEKEKASAVVLEAMERYFPGFTQSVDMTDVATPVTFYRYTANQEGSLIAWGAVPGTPMMLKKTILGKKNLYLAGHWVMPGGGVPQAALSARHAVQAICLDEKIRCHFPASDC